MEVTNVRIDRFEPKDSGICADVSVTLDDVLVIHSIHVILGKKSLFVGFPHTGLAKMTQGGKRYDDIVHPIDKNLRQQIETKVLEEYSKVKP